MKNLIGILTLGLAAIAFTPAAEARPYDRDGYYDGGGYDRYDGGGGRRGGDGCSRRYVEYARSCGGPAYIETYVAFYNDCGRPVYRTRVIPIVVRRPPPPPPAYCPPPVYRDCDRGPRFTVEVSGGWR